MPAIRDQSLKCPKAKRSRIEWIHIESRKIKCRMQARALSIACIHSSRMSQYFSESDTRFVRNSIQIFKPNLPITRTYSDLLFARFTVAHKPQSHPTCSELCAQAMAQALCEREKQNAAFNVRFIRSPHNSISFQKSVCRCFQSFACVRESSAFECAGAVESSFQ